MPALSFCVNRTSWTWYHLSAWVLPVEEEVAVFAVMHARLSCLVPHLSPSNIKILISLIATLHVLYIINCKHCNLKYVGCTKRKLKLHNMKLHSRTQKQKKTKCQGQPSTLSNYMKVLFAFEKVMKPRRGGDWICKMYHREAFWIHQFAIF